MLSKNSNSLFVIYSNRILVLLFFLTLIKPSVGFSQQKLDLNDLRTPTTPAFILLGIEPTSVERPSTPKLLSTSLYSLVGQENVIPDNYALEVAPYWLTSHPMLTFDDYYNADLGQRLLQTLSISLATSKGLSAEDSLNNDGRVGLGVRAQLYSGKADSGLIKLRKQLLDKQNEVLDLLLIIDQDDKKKEIDANKENIFKLTEDYLKIEIAINNLELDIANSEGNLDDKRTELLRKRLDLSELEYEISRQERQIRKSELEIVKIQEEIDYKNKELKEISEKMKSANKKRVGFVLELAGAMVVDFANNNFDNGDVSRIGFWITPTYRFEKPFIDFITVIRLTSIESHDNDGFLFDLGGRLLWQNEVIALSIEYVNRNTIDISIQEENTNGTSGSFNYKDTYRLSGNLEYRLNDNLYLTASLGRNYEEMTEGQNTLISLIGINFGFGQAPSLNLK